MRTWSSSLILVAACATGSADDTTDDTGDTEVADPTIVFVSPEEDEIVTGGVSGAVDVVLDVTGITLVPRDMGTGYGVEGFILLTPDGNTLIQSEMQAETTSMSGLFAGGHTLRAELVLPDGTPFDPPLFDEVSFEVVP